MVAAEVAKSTRAGPWSHMLRNRVTQDGTGAGATVGALRS